MTMMYGEGDSVQVELDGWSEHVFFFPFSSMSHICVSDRETAWGTGKEGKKPFRTTKDGKARLALWSICLFFSSSSTSTNWA